MSHPHTGPVYKESRRAYVCGHCEHLDLGKCTVAGTMVPGAVAPTWCPLLPGRVPDTSRVPGYDPLVTLRQCLASLQERKG